MLAIVLLLSVLSLTAQTGFAQQDDTHAEDRRQLRLILHEVESSINAQTLDRMVQQMDRNVVVVWANGEVSRGPADVLNYYERMVKGKDRILTKYLTTAHLHGPARFLDNDVAIADGSMDDDYFPVFRRPFRLQNKWTATVARIQGEWKIASLHLSGNVFNNVLLDELKAALLYTAVGGLIVGSLAGWGLTRFVARRRTG